MANEWIECLVGWHRLFYQQLQNPRENNQRCIKINLEEDKIEEQWKSEVNTEVSIEVRAEHSLG